MFTARFQAWVRRQAQSLAAVLGRLPVTPNQVTVAGMLISFGAAGLIATNHLFWGGLVLAVGGTFDILDGALARVQRKTYPYGAFFDSSLDRYSEAAVYLGLAAYYLWQPGRSGLVLVTMLALIGSQLVSYVRARAQSLGFKCESGLLARPERVVAMVAGLLFGGVVLVWVVVALAVLTNVTALQRVWEVWRQARAQRQVTPVARPALTAPAKRRAPGGVPRTSEFR
jgi:CDP-diacylglycerol--glycerol-3-phosphate 3-phosphatidyltransferase